MTDGPAGGIPWWEFDPDEKPVPLGAQGQWGLADEAELIVNSERVAIAREDTEPPVQRFAGRPSLTGDEVGDSGLAQLTRSRSVLVLAIALLVAGCVAMFSLGWSQGVAARAPHDRFGSIPPPEVSQVAASGVGSATVLSAPARLTRGSSIDGLRESQDKEVWER